MGLPRHQFIKLDPIASGKPSKNGVNCLQTLEANGSAPPGLQLPIWRRDVTSAITAPLIYELVYLCRQPCIVTSLWHLYGLISQAKFGLTVVPNLTLQQLSDRVAALYTAVQKAIWLRPALRLKLCW
jgi:hypothetical protein